jgi:hypothetical protein
MSLDSTISIILSFVVVLDDRISPERLPGGRKNMEKQENQELRGRRRDNVLQNEIMA